MRMLSKRSVARGGIGMFILLLWSVGIGTVLTYAAAEYDRTRVVVKLAPMSGQARQVTPGSSGRSQFDQAMSDLGVKQIRQIFPPVASSHPLAARATMNRMADYVLVRIPVGIEPDLVLQYLSSLRDVESAEFDGIAHIEEGGVTPNDPYYATHQYALRNTGVQPPYDPGTAGADVDMEAAWAFTTGDTGVVIAIVDTGIDMLHPDLAGKIWVNVDELPDEFDNDHNGYPGDVNGWNFVHNTPFPMDDHSHGTHVAGIAGAIGNNGIGIAGMDSQCRLMPVKVLSSSGSGSSADVASGIYYAANNGADVINLSLGSNQSSGVEEAAIDYAYAAGVTICAAMGNDSTGVPLYPAANLNVIAVGATDSDDRRALPFCFSPSSGSNYGSWIDVCAPGDNVWSTVPVSMGSYANKCGTSMATPHVAGLAALVKALRPGFTPAQVKNIIELGAEDQVGRPTEDTPGFDIYHGWGRINGRATLQALAAALPPMLTVPGSQTITELDTLRFVISAIDSNFTMPTLSMLALANAMLVDSGNGSGVFTFVPDVTQQGPHVLTVIASDGALADTELVAITVGDTCLCQKHGDVNGDGVMDVLDVVEAIDGVFQGATPPPQDADCPMHIHRGDFNCDSTYDVLDVVALIDHVFQGAAGPCRPCLL